MNVGDQEREENIENQLFAVSSIDSFNYVGRGLGGEVTPPWHQDTASIFLGGVCFLRAVQGLRPCLGKRKVGQPVLRVVSPKPPDAFSLHSSHLLG